MNNATPWGLVAAMVLSTVACGGRSGFDVMYRDDYVETPSEPASEGDASPVKPSQAPTAGAKESFCADAPPNLNACLSHALHTRPDFEAGCAIDDAGQAWSLDIGSRVATLAATTRWIVTKFQPHETLVGPFTTNVADSTVRAYVGSRATNEWPWPEKNEVNRVDICLYRDGDVLAVKLEDAIASDAQLVLTLRATALKLDFIDKGRPYIWLRANTPRAPRP